MCIRDRTTATRYPALLAVEAAKNASSKTQTVCGSGPPRLRFARWYTCLLYTSVIDKHSLGHHGRAAEKLHVGVEHQLQDVYKRQTLRLGSYPCVLDKDSKAFSLYGAETIHERHRHRYEVNNDYRKILTDNGLKLSGLSPDGRIVEMIEIPSHPWFMATQAHPELKSRPNRPHPLFQGFIEAALKTR